MNRDDVYMMPTHVMLTYEDHSGLCSLWDLLHQPHFMFGSGVTENCSFSLDTADNKVSVNANKLTPTVSLVDLKVEIKASASDPPEETILASKPLLKYLLPQPGGNPELHQLLKSITKFVS